MLSIGPANRDYDYYTEHGQVTGYFSGELARDLGLDGAVIEPAHFNRLINGRHPLTDEQLVRHVRSRRIIGRDGQEHWTATHRAGQDSTYSAPKSVSIAALIGGDMRVVAAHERACAAGRRIEEQAAMARIGGNRPAEQTGKLIFLTFGHTTSRPDRDKHLVGVLLHQHGVVVNLTLTPARAFKPLQPLEMFRSKSLATAVYRTVLASELTKLGYEIEPDALTSAPELKGISKEYREAASPRHRELLVEAETVQRWLVEKGVENINAPALRSRATTRHRSVKNHDSEATYAQWQELEKRFGGQARRVAGLALERECRQAAKYWDEESSRQRARVAVEHAIERAKERHPGDVRPLLCDALRHGLGLTTLEDVLAEVDVRERSGGLRGLVLSQEEIKQAAAEREGDFAEQVSAVIRSGREARPIPGSKVGERLPAPQSVSLIEGQREVIAEILASRDRVIGLVCPRGAVKLGLLKRLIAEARGAGLETRVITPSSRQARALCESGLESQALRQFERQSRRVEEEPSGNRLLLFDGASSASVRQLNNLLSSASEHDMILLIGGRRREGDDANSPFERLRAQEMWTITLDASIHKQTSDEAGRRMTGDITTIIERLHAQGQLIETPDEGERLRALVLNFCERPESTLVITHGEDSCAKINLLIHEQRLRDGQLGLHPRAVKLLVSKFMSGEERISAGAYELGDVLLYKRDSRHLGVRAGQYARVMAVDIESGMLSVKFEDDQSRLRYEPKKILGVEVYRGVEFRLAVSERVQFRLSHRELGVTRGELGTIEKMKGESMTVRLDSGREVVFSVKEYRHLDYGYAADKYPVKKRGLARIIINADMGDLKVMTEGNRLMEALSHEWEGASVYTNSINDLKADLVNREAAIEEFGRAPARQHESEAEQQRSNQDENCEQGGRIPAQKSAGAKRRGVAIIAGETSSERQSEGGTESSTRRDIETVRLVDSGGRIAPVYSQAGPGNPRAGTEGTGRPTPPRTKDQLPGERARGAQRVFWEIEGGHAEQPGGRSAGGGKLQIGDGAERSPAGARAEEHHTTTGGKHGGDVAHQPDAARAVNRAAEIDRRDKPRDLTLSKRERRPFTQGRGGRARVASSGGDVAPRAEAIDDRDDDSWRGGGDSHRGVASPRDSFDDSLNHAHAPAAQPELDRSVRGQLEKSRTDYNLSVATELLAGDDPSLELQPGIHSSEWSVGGLSKEHESMAEMVADILTGTAMEGRAGGEFEHQTNQNTPEHGAKFERVVDPQSLAKGVLDESIYAQPHWTGTQKEHTEDRGGNEIAGFENYHGNREHSAQEGSQPGGRG